MGYGPKTVTQRASDYPQGREASNQPRQLLLRPSPRSHQWIADDLVNRLPQLPESGTADEN